ncbi:MAG TPA: prepilin-type N-terminal cleavage/methylation domain-containing protein [Candidatus Paceibacterota bacterium]|nr:prepilin-type N-terminal cleavage/methylation domain-containing protein [Candidatus Paceibacterota bacterium]
MKKYYSKFKKKFASSFGFTLIETLVALAIFSASVVALISVTASGVANTNFAKNKITASYLAQEGVELVRNIRDNAILGSNDWTEFLSDIGPCGGGCTIDPVDLGVSGCANAGGCQLFYTSSGNDPGFYRPTISLGEESIFYSLIVVDNNFSSGAEAKVISTIFWNQGGAQRRVSASENLFNWTQ